MTWTTLKLSKGGAVVGVPTGEEEVVVLHVQTPPIIAVMLEKEERTEADEDRFREWVKPFIGEWVVTRDAT